MDRAPPAIDPDKTHEMTRDSAEDYIHNNFGGASGELAGS